MDTVKIHTVFITYNRLELTKRAIESYLETVSVPFHCIVVDNGSNAETTDWLLGIEWLAGNVGPQIILLGENRYPGYATNYGWHCATRDATHLHRADNDFAFLPGWCEEVERKFRNHKIGQVGLRTSEQEPDAPANVGGNCVIRRELWDAGLRYDETPWPELREKYGPGFSEDSFFSPKVREMGWEWTRVNKQCLVSLASGDWSDNYYRTSYGVRGITPREDDPTVPEGFVPYGS